MKELLVPKSRFQIWRAKIKQSLDKSGFKERFAKSPLNYIVAAVLYYIATVFLILILIGGTYFGAWINTFAYDGEYILKGDAPEILNILLEIGAFMGSIGIIILVIYGCFSGIYHLWKAYFNTKEVI